MTNKLTTRTYKEGVLLIEVKHYCTQEEAFEKLKELTSEIESRGFVRIYEDKTYHAFVNNEKHEKIEILIKGD